MATKKMCFQDLFEWVYDFKNIDKPEYNERKRELATMLIKQDIKQKARSLKKYCGVTMFSISSEYNVESIRYNLKG